MPIYEYTCSRCETGFEHLARSLTDTPKKCPKCGSGRFSKQFSAFATTKTFQISSDCGGCAKAPACPAAGTAAGGCCGGSCA